MCITTKCVVIPIFISGGHFLSETTTLVDTMKKRRTLLTVYSASIYPNNAERNITFNVSLIRHYYHNPHH